MVLHLLLRRRNKDRRPIEGNGMWMWHEESYIVNLGKHQCEKVHWEEDNLVKKNSYYGQTHTVRLLTIVLDRDRGRNGALQYYCTASFFLELTDGFKGFADGHNSFLCSRRNSTTQKDRQTEHVWEHPNRCEFILDVSCVVIDEPFSLSQRTTPEGFPHIAGMRQTHMNVILSNPD